MNLTKMISIVDSDSSTETRGGRMNEENATKQGINILRYILTNMFVINFFQPKITII